MQKIIRSVGIGFVLGLWAALTLLAWCVRNRELSIWERRPLQQRPALSAQAVLIG